MTLLYIFSAILVADFITGLLHWIEDTYGLPSWPFIGKTVIVANINHHKHPSMAGFMGSLLARLGSPLYIFVGVIGATWLAGWFTWWLLLVGCLAMLGNEVHNWNHDICRHWSINLLRNGGIIQSKKHHAIHHIPPYDKRYCTLTNYLNPILDTFKFWRAIEWLLKPIVTPKRLSPEREGY